jgi:ribonuclease HI/ADP-ribose pyrophosphatase YjhB (NUDIX family)
MKQRVVVQAIITDKERVLLLRRSQGRAGIVGKYELPGGTIEDNEQPADSLRRHLHNNLGIDIAQISLRLNDVMSMKNREEGDFQHIFIVYSVEGVGIDIPIKLGQSYDSYQWILMSEIQHQQLRDSAFYLLGIEFSQVEQIPKGQFRDDIVVKETSIKSNTIIYSDGGSRGNPGPSAAAFVIVENETVIDQGGEYIGITTNNQAEYQGVRLGLERAIERGISSLEFRIDSMLVVNQLNGLYTIKNRELWPINERIQSLLKSFNSIKFKHVPREMNALADALVNKYLDEHTATD